MPTTDEIRSTLKPVIAQLIEVDDFGDDEDFVQDLGVDSMMGIEIAARVEKTYRIQIPEDELRRIKTFNDVVDVAETALNKLQTPA
jgi:acyl carrier protein